jgi:serine phosphatase RsbU (regulator of sigma subunit)
MLEQSHSHKTVLEVAFPGQPLRLVPVTHSPFLLGHGSDTGNHLLLEDHRISRRCAAIVSGKGGHRLEDWGSRTGIFVNGEKIAKRTLRDGDTIAFGLNDSCTIVFRSTASHATLASVLTRMGNLHNGAGAHESHGLSKLNLLLEATSLLHSQLPLDSVLASMLDHAIAITKADRGLLLEADPAGTLKPRLARNSGGESLRPESIAPNQAVLDLALEEKTDVIVGDPDLADADRKTAQRIIHVHPHSFIATALYASSASVPAGEPVGESEESNESQPQRGELVGVIYLDSTHPAAFSTLVRHIFDALGAEAASILENARHMQRERERRLLEHELSIARSIQQALLPKGYHDFPHLTVIGVNYPCIAVGGDYFDVYPVSEDQTAVLIADVSGHGLGAAMLTTMLQGALSGMVGGGDPVRVFNQINQLLCEHTDVGKYATMFFSLLHCDGTFSYIKAGHPSPLLLRRGEVSELYTDGSFPVGLLEEAKFTADTIQLEPEDTIVLFSDGVTEAEDPDGNQFGLDRLREILTGHQETPLDDLKKIITDAVDTFSRGAAQQDDITVLVMRFRACA